MDDANHEADTPPAGKLLITYPVNQLLPQDEAIATDPTGTFWQPDVTQHDDDSIDGGSALQVEEELEDFLKNSTAALKADPEAPDLSRGVPFTLSKSDSVFSGSFSTSSTRVETTRVAKESSEGWMKLFKIVRQYDETKIGDCKEDMDSLVVVAGIFSAIVGAFNIEQYKALQEDPAVTTVHLLTQLNNQMSGAVNTSSSSSISFEIQASDVRVAFFWFLSLVSSLITASLAISVKQWLREYISQDSISPQGYVRVRHFRQQGLVDWRVFEIAAVLPLLLQCSMILFFIGLCDFLHSLYPALGWTITTVVMLWLLAYFATILGPLFAASCPYKTPLLKVAPHWQVVLFKYIAEWASYLFEWIAVQLQGLIRRSSRHSITSSRPELPKVYVRSTSRSQYEQNIRVAMDLDVQVLVALDATFIEDDFMETVQACLADIDGAQVVDCVRHFMQRRTGRPVESLQNLTFDDRDLAKNAALTSYYTLFVHILSDAVAREIDKLRIVNGWGETPMEWTMWMSEAVPWILRKLDAIPAQVLLVRLLSQDMGATHQVLAHLSKNIQAINSWPPKTLSMNIEDTAGGYYIHAINTEHLQLNEYEILVVMGVIFAARRPWWGTRPHSVQEPLSLCLAILLLAAHTSAETLSAGVHSELHDLFLGILNLGERNIARALANLPSSCILAAYDHCNILSQKAPDAVPTRLFLHIQRALIRAAGWSGPVRSLKRLDHDKMTEAASIVRYRLSKAHSAGYS